MPNIVLIPGAWLGGWVWKKIIPGLEKNGNTVYPITLTGMGERVHLASRDFGIETGILDVLHVIEFEDIHDIVMVGHSFAGKVAAAVADRVPERIRMVLYLDSFWPRKTSEPQGAYNTVEEFGKQPDGSFSIPFYENILNNIGSDVVGQDREWMVSKATPWPIRYAEEPITLSDRFFSLNGSHIFCTKAGDPVDEIIAGKWGDLSGPYRVMDTGHYPMVTRPEELVENMISLIGSA